MTYLSKMKSQHHVEGVIYRMASSEDAESILDIYRPFVLHSHTSFEYEVPTVQEIARRISETLTQDPWLIAEKGKTVLGYAYAGVFRKRRAYWWTREISIYMSEQSIGTGVSYLLYKKLIDLLTAQGYFQLIAGIALPNDRSIRFHEKCGFSYVGKFEGIGFKNAVFHDVGFWQKPINCDDQPHHTPRKIEELSVEELKKILG